MVEVKKIMILYDMLALFVVDLPEYFWSKNSNHEFDKRTVNESHPSMAVRSASNTFLTTVLQGGLSRHN